MAISITEDVVSGARLRHTPYGTIVLRKFAVTGMDPTQASNVGLVWGVSDSVTGRTLPQLGEGHPTIPSLFVTDFDSEPMGNEQSPNKGGVWATVGYRSPEWATNTNVTQIEIASISEIKTLNRWPSGPQMGKTILVGVGVDKTTQKVDPKGSFPPQIDPSTVSAADAAAQGVYFDTVELPVLGGGVVMRFTRREVNPPSFAFKNKTNQSPWQSLPAGCWLMKDITARKIFYPSVVFEVSYTIISADPLDIQFVSGTGYGGFTQIAFFRDAETNQAMPGAGPGSTDFNGWTAIDPYPRVDFNALGLPAVY